MREDDSLSRTFLLQTSTLQKLLKSMTRYELHKINDPRCRNEKDFFLSFFSDGDVDELDLQGQGDKYPADFLPPPQVWFAAEKRLFHCSFSTARHVLLQIKPSRSQSHLFVSERKQNGILRNNNKFTVDVRNHNKLSVS